MEKLFNVSLKLNTPISIILFETGRIGCELYPAFLIIHGASRKKALGLSTLVFWFFILVNKMYSIIIQFKYFKKLNFIYGIHEIKNKKQT